MKTATPTIRTSQCGSVYSVANLTSVDAYKFLVTLGAYESSATIINEQNYT